MKIFGIRRGFHPDTGKPYGMMCRFKAETLEEALKLEEAETKAQFEAPGRFWSASEAPPVSEVVEMVPIPKEQWAK